MNVKELIQRAADTWNSRDQEGYFATYADDCELIHPLYSGTGVQGLAGWWALLNDSFSDNQVILQRVFAEGPHVAQEALFEGTNDGPLAAPDGSPLPATGQRLSTRFSAVHVVRDDRIVSTRFYADRLDMLIQLGLMPG